MVQHSISLVLAAVACIIIPAIAAPAAPLEFQSRDFDELEVRGNALVRVATGLSGGSPGMSGGQLLKDATDGVAAATKKDDKKDKDKKEKKDKKKKK